MTLLFKDGYKMSSVFQEPGFVRVTDSNGADITLSKAEWDAKVALALANGASRV